MGVESGTRFYGTKSRFLLRVLMKRMENVKVTMGVPVPIHNVAFRFALGDGVATLVAAVLILSGPSSDYPATLACGGLFVIAGHGLLLMTTGWCLRLLWRGCIEERSGLASIIAGLLGGTSVFASPYLGEWLSAGTDVSAVTTVTFLIVYPVIASFVLFQRVKVDRSGCIPTTYPSCNQSDHDRIILEYSSEVKPNGRVRRLAGDILGLTGFLFTALGLFRVVIIPFNMKMFSVRVDNITVIVAQVVSGGACFGTAITLVFLALVLGNRRGIVGVLAILSVALMLLALPLGFWALIAR